MAFKADLTVKGTVYKVLHCNYSLRRNTDEKGQPSSFIYGGRIDLTLESGAKTELLELMVDHAQFDATMVVKKDDQEAKLRDFTFTEAHIVSFEESINAYSSDEMTHHITITANKMKIGDASIDNEWKKN